MADLGTDAGHATLNLSTKVLELIGKLIDKIFDLIVKSKERGLVALEYKQAKTKAEQDVILRRLRSKAGLVTKDQMEKTGKERMNVGVQMSPEDMKLFSDIAKRYELPFYGLEVPGTDQKELGIFCEDLERFNLAYSRLSDEKILNKIQQDIDNLERKGVENLSDEEKDMLRNLKEAKQAKIDQITNNFNEEMDESIMKDAVLDDFGDLRKMDIQEGLDRLTGYNLSKPDSGDFVLASATKPGDYIKVHGFDDSFENEKGKKINYVRSQYDVYKNGELIKKFDDRRYVGRPKGYWESIKSEMSNILGNPKFFYKFKTESIYKSWEENVTKQNNQRMNNNTIESLKDELQKKGFGYENGNATLLNDVTAKDGTIIPKGQVIDKEFLVNVLGRSNEYTSFEQRQNLVEAFLIKQSMDSLEKSNELEEKLGLKKAEIVVEEDPAKVTQLKSEYDDLDKKLKAEKENIDRINDRRTRLIASREERNLSNSKEDHTRDDSREEHINENAQTFAQQTPDDWKSEIEKNRVDKAVKNNDMAVKGQTMEHADIAKDISDKTR